jgi:shikimate kinase
VRGVGRATGAISFVNGVFTGRGCAAAIELGCEALVHLDRSPPGEVPRIRLDPASDTPLARSSIQAALLAYLPHEHVHVEAEVRSALPWAQGLKSSSAVSVALLEAVANARGQTPDPIDLARRSADLCQTIGLSATGAFDDAAAASLGGVVLADNPTRTILSHTTLDPRLAVALWFPGGLHDPSPQLEAQFRALRVHGFEAVRAAESQRYFEAMAINTRIVEQALGLNFAHLHRVLSTHGALASGISGMGPALAAIGPADRIDEVAAVFPQHRGSTRVTRFRPPGDPAAGSFDAEPPARTGGRSP